jgi:preprotein translocase subunit SecY
MALEKLDPLLNMLPSISKSNIPLSLKEKLKWTAILMAVYYVLFSVPAIGVNTSATSQGVEQLISIIFAARIGTIITVGISPIVVAGIIFSFLSGADIIKIDQNNPLDRSRMQGLQKLTAIVIAAAEAFIFTATGQITLLSNSFYGLVILQLFIGAVIIIYMDEAMSKFGITSGINLFICGNVAFSVVAGTVNILGAEALTYLAGRGATALPNAILAFGPLFFAVAVLLVSIYAYETNLEIPLVFSQFRGVGGRLPIPLLYVSVLPVVLATAMQLNLVILAGFLAGYHGPLMGLANFLASFSGVGGSTRPVLSGGLIYLISPNFPLPYSGAYGGLGGYPEYFNYLLTNQDPIYSPFGGSIFYVPEWVHVIVYSLVLIILCVIFGKFWTGMAGQDAKSLAAQLGDVGWQIPGFRRDPRTVEAMLNRYIPSIITLGSMFVGILAAFATITAAIGSGVGILLSVGIIYMIYKQMDQERMFETYPQLNRLIS